MKLRKYEYNLTDTACTKMASGWDSSDVRNQSCEDLEEIGIATAKTLSLKWVRHVNYEKRSGNKEKYIGDVIRKEVGNQIMQASKWEVWIFVSWWWVAIGDLCNRIWFHIWGNHCLCCIEIMKSRGARREVIPTNS